MGMYKWKPNMIKYMEDASINTSYYKRLSEIIMSFVPKNAKVCDVGCGLGHLSLQMAKDGLDVTSIDINAEVTNRLSKVGGNIKNLKVICGDIFTMEISKGYDAAVFCMFGSFNEVKDICSVLGAKKAVVIKRRNDNHRFTLNNKENRPSKFMEFVNEARCYSNNVEVILEDISLDQPFRTINDAIDFFNTYNKGDKPIIREDIIPLLKPCKMGEFNYYLPVLNEIGIVKIIFN